MPRARPHPDPVLLLGELALDRQCARHGGARRVEDDEESVAGGAHVATTARGHLVEDDRIVDREQRCGRVVAEAGGEVRRRPDIREHDRRDTTRALLVHRPTRAHPPTARTAAPTPRPDARAPLNRASEAADLRPVVRPRSRLARQASLKSPSSYTITPRSRGSSRAVILITDCCRANAAAMPEVPPVIGAIAWRRAYGGALLDRAVPRPVRQGEVVGHRLGPLVGVVNYPVLPGEPIDP